MIVTADGEAALLMRQTETDNAADTTYLERITGFPDSADPVRATADLLAELARARGRWGRGAFVVPAAGAVRPAGRPAGGRRGPVAHIDGALAAARLVKSPAEIEQVRPPPAAPTPGWPRRRWPPCPGRVNARSRQPRSRR
ncbi:hypothetical protein NKH77_49705 [Streptomyces sp. M19]